MNTDSIGIYGLLIAFILAINDVISFGLAKLTYLQTFSQTWLIIPVILYSFQLPLFYYGLNYSSMLLLNKLWNLISNILITLIGFFYFKERINNIEIVGLIFGFVSIACFTYDDILKIIMSKDMK
jgi:multidrug transporter EmrE-like cation transporter